MKRELQTHHKSVVLAEKTRQWVSVLGTVITRSDVSWLPCTGNYGTGKNIPVGKLVGNPEMRAVGSWNER